MRILVYPHDLGIGGSQLNAIEIAAAVRGLGHDVVIYGQSGSLVATIQELGLTFIESPKIHHRPTLGIVRDLRRIVVEQGIDILHGYEWPPALECHLAARSGPAVTTVCTVMSMAVAPFVPHTMPLLVGTQQIAAAESDAGRPLVGVIEPPVDIDINRGDLGLDRDTFLRSWGLDPCVPTVVVVSRLAVEMKMEGILAAMHAVAKVNENAPAQLMIVGGGPGRVAAEELARQVNLTTRRRTVVLTGDMYDPRPAYAAADVTLGMGGSALRALAFAKPLVVQGERGFWELLTPQSLPTFTWQGWYGAGQGMDQGPDRLAGILARLLPDRALRRRLGEFGRQTVVERFSLQTAALAQCEFYQRARTWQPERAQRLMADLSAMGRFTRYAVKRNANGVVGRATVDDFNARPVAAGTGQIVRSAS